VKATTSPSASTPSAMMRPGRKRRVICSGLERQVVAL
jgi:hypothetical protein